MFARFKICIKCIQRPPNSFHTESRTDSKFGRQFVGLYAIYEQFILDGVHRWFSACEIGTYVSAGATDDNPEHTTPLSSLSLFYIAVSETHSILTKRLALL